MCVYYTVYVIYGHLHTVHTHDILYIYKSCTPTVCIYVSTYHIYWHMIHIHIWHDCVHVYRHVSIYSIYRISVYVSIDLTVSVSISCIYELTYILYVIAQSLLCDTCVQYTQGQYIQTCIYYTYMTEYSTYWLYIWCHTPYVTLHTYIHVGSTPTCM